VNQPLWKQLLVTFACLFPFLFILIIISANMTEREIGEPDGNKVFWRGIWLISLIFFVILIVGGLSRNIKIEDWIPFLQIGTGLLLAILGGRLWFIRQRQIVAEEVVYDMGRVESLAVRLAGIVFGLGFVVMLLLAISEGNMQFWGVGYFAFIGGASLYWNVFGQGHVYLTKNGVLRFSTGLIPWEKIESYEWGGKFNRSLIFNMAKGKIWFPLKIMQHDEVEAVVSQFVPLKSRSMADENFVDGFEEE